ncbi:NAD-dependent epimerase [Konateibacter massiliensis]|uniref:NAD-dependent epimerase n=1 Tax=Konateibacter massiliensis TaxID=2002841 RepID=UPI000C14B0FE|nr:NAD-dependent epimerase [Konateibacter massiliensis]
MRSNYKELDENEVVLITGAAGFIGFYLAKRLLAKGNAVIGFDNLNSYYDINLKKSRLEILEKYKGFQFIKGDLADKEALEAIFKDNKIDIVVNLAAQAGVRYSIENPEAYIQSNIVGFFNVLECCRYYPVKHLLYASSSSVYGGNDKVPFSTDDKVDMPVSLYAATKKSNELMAYSYCKLYGIKATGLRFFTVYGPMGRPDMAYFSFSEKIMREEPIKIFNDGNMYRDFTYIDDIVEGIIRMLANPPVADINNTNHKIYNIGNNHPEKLMDFIEILENALGKEAKKEFYPMQPGDVYQTYADVSELEKDFEFKPATSLRSGLSKFTEWFLGEYISK